MARMKNVGGGPGDEDPRRPPRLPIDPKGKATKKVASKKRKYPDAEKARAAIVAEAAERVEREEVLTVELLLQIICLQRRMVDLSVLSVFMVVHLGLS